MERRSDAVKDRRARKNRGKLSQHVLGISVGVSKAQISLDGAGVWAAKGLLSILYSKTTIRIRSSLFCPARTKAAPASQPNEVLTSHWTTQAQVRAQKQQEKVVNSIKVFF